MQVSILKVVTFQSCRGVKEVTVGFLYLVIIYSNFVRTECCLLKFQKEINFPVFIYLFS